MIDLERCTGCKSCEAACKQTNALGPHSYRNRVMWFDQQPRLDFLTVTCQQCERPACLRACPVYPKAISKDPDTGVVAIDIDRCTGCGECVLSCPYGAIGYNAERHHAVKCDLCADRRSKDLQPACATVCPTLAISFGRRTSLLEKAQQEQREVLDTDHFLQNPATIYLQRLTVPEHLSIPALLTDHTTRYRIKTDAGLGSYNASHKSLLKQTEERIVPGGCPICFNACPVKYHLRGNEVVNVYGNDEDSNYQGRICPKSQMTLQMYQNPHRLTYPLKRIGARGSDHFERISWDQAMTEIAEKLQIIRDHYGSEALAIQSGSRTGTLNIIGIIPLFTQLWGTPNFVTTEPYCSMSKSVALQLTQGSGMMASAYTEDDIGSAEAYIYIGDNQAETRPVHFGMVNDWRIKNKARMIVVDPRLTATASKADEWLPIRSGTDMALGLGIIHYLFQQQLFNEEFCQRWITGWQQWRKFVVEKQYDLDWAAGVTDLSANQIRDLATTIAKANGCMIFLSRGINQHTNSAQTNRVFMFVAAMTGNWGRRGGGYFNVTSEMDWEKPAVDDDRKPATRPAISTSPAAWFEAMTAHKPYPLRALITSNNPMTHWPNQNLAREAVKALDLVVHLELFKNATSRYADYVLPMASGIEKGGTTRFAEDRRIVWNDRLIDPPGEVRSDHWFWIELGKCFGFEDILKEDYKDPRKIWDELLVPQNPRLSGADTAYLIAQPNRSVRLPRFDSAAGEIDPVYITENQAEYADQSFRFDTDSGKLEFWTETLEQKFNETGLSALPEFYSEAEQLIDLPFFEYATKSSLSNSTGDNPPRPVGKIVSPARQRSDFYDTELVTGRPPAPHFHSWTHYFWQAQEMWPELYCQIHPEKAAKIGIEDGDQVRIETENGSLQARAWVRRGIRPSSIFVPIGWDEQQPFHPASSVNHLTGIRLDPISQQANLKTGLCRISRVD
jgi:anaerobic selenocysteine-containing dehydrogenase/Fe-S-cluster-containing hydrogenase component 2